MTVAVTGASGQLGRLVAERLLTLIDPGEVVLVTRDPDRLADLANQGAQVRRGDFTEPASLSGAFAGVERLLLISTDLVGERLDGHLNAIGRAAAAGVERIAYTSVPRPDPANPAGVVPDHAATETALRAAGPAWTLLRNNLYAEMQVPTIEQAAQAGILVTNTGSGGAAYVTRADCAAVAAAVLITDGHEGRIYDVTGPTAVSAVDLAALATRMSGTETTIDQVDDDAYAAMLEQAGLPGPVAALVTSFGASIRGGWLDEVSDTVAQLTGSPPVPLGDLVA